MTDDKVGSFHSSVATSMSVNVDILVDALGLEVVFEWRQKTTGSFP